MCGIAGWIGSSPELTGDRVRAMTDSMRRRGPDGEGLETWPQAVLGHRRLSIFDLSEAGRQPMMTADRQVGLVFNGAIYNFLDLRAELEGRGCRFVSHTDTEVILHGYREWGIDVLIQRMRGMFAIAIWDNQLGKLHLVRDRLGVKPMYFARGAKGSIAFASTARALRAAGLGAELDETAMAEYLEFGYVTDAQCIYRGMHKLAAGHLLTWCNGAIQERCYWTPPAVGEHQRIRFEDAIEQTEELLLKAVKLRLFADVPVGALLSGGVDSSLVCWAIAKLGGNLTAYTVGTPKDPAADESGIAAHTARKLGIHHKVLPMHAEEGASVAELVAAFGEPFACSSALGMLQLSRAIKPEATVLLTGDGGDDVFLGYPEHKHLFMAQRLAQWIPAPLAAMWRTMRGAVSKLPKMSRPAHFLDYATGGLGAVTEAHEGWPTYLRQGMLGERMRDYELAQRRIPWSIEAGRRVLDDMLVYDRNGRFVGEFMTKVDGGAMHYALEARSPFLDHEVWEFAARLPYQVRLHGGVLKAVLRGLVKRRLGESLAAEKKRGFTIPAQRWLANRWYADAREMFSESVLAEEGWMNSAAVLSQLELARAHGFASLQLWYWYVLENWVRFEKASGGVQDAVEVEQRA